MATTAFPDPDDSSIEALFGDELAASDQALANVQPILRHLLGNDDHALFSDRMVAQVRAQLHDLARQMVVALEQEAGNGAPRDALEARCETLAGAFAAHSVLLGHAHALAFEALVADRLAARLSLDPVLSPLLQALIGSPDPNIAATAMKFLAAQARFGQAQKRGELALAELPGDLLHLALIVMRAWIGAEDPARDARAAAVEQSIRAAFDESESRLGLLGRLVGGMGGGAIAALDAAHGGVALFVTALALGSGQDRDTAVLALSEGQMPRLALALLASGAKPAAVEQQFLALHPDVTLPEGFEALSADRAAALLAGASGSAGF